jgi:hypothetical protein
MRCHSYHICMSKAGSSTWSHLWLCTILIISCFHCSRSPTPFASPGLYHPQHGWPLQHCQSAPHHLGRFWVYGFDTVSSPCQAISTPHLLAPEVVLQSPSLLKLFRIVTTFLHIHDHINSFAFLRKYTFVSMYRVTFLSACNDARQLIHKTKYDTCFHATSVFVITEIGIGRVWITIKVIAT